MTTLEDKLYHYERNNQKLLIERDMKDSIIEENNKEINKLTMFLKKK